MAAGDSKRGGVRDRSSRTSLDGGVTGRIEGGLGDGCLLGGADNGGIDNGRGLVVAGGVDDRLVDAGGRRNVDGSGRLSRNLGLSGRGSHNNLGGGMGAQRAIGHGRVALGKSDNLGSGRGESRGLKRSRRRSVVLSSGDRGASGGNEDAGVVHCDCCLSETNCDKSEGP